MKNLPKIKEELEMKKVLSLMLVIAMVVSLTACGGNSESTASTDSTVASTSSAAAESSAAAPVEKSGKVTVWAWDPNFNIPVMKAAAEIYNKTNPNVQFEISDIAKADVEQKLHTNLASGVAEGLPEITLIEDYNAQLYLQSYPGSFADLTGKIKYDDFAKYKVALMTLDSKTYGVPFDSGVTAFFYRSDIMEQAGFKAEDLNNITWDKYIEIGKTVKAKTGKDMLAFDPTDGGSMRVMMQSAGQWYYDNDGKPQLTNDVVKEAAETYKKLLDAKIAKPTKGWTEWVAAFNKGEVASVITGCWIIGSIKAEASQSGKWAVANTPKLNNANSVNFSNLGGSSWYVLEKSKNKEVAIDFLNTVFGANVDFYQDILTKQGAIGSYIPAANGSAYSSPDEFFGGQKVFADLASWMQKIPSVDYGLYTYQADAAIMGLSSEIASGKDLDATLKKAEDALKQQIGN